MRREARQERQVNIARIEGYHHGDHDEKLVFSSDRPMKADYDYTVNGKLPKMYGLEIELQCWGITNKTVLANILKNSVFNVFPADLFKMESDCSLTDNCDSSAECITQPMTKAFIRNHYKDFKAMYNDMFPAYGISCSQTGDCGMHAHISLSCFGSEKRTQDEAIRKLYYIINKHYKFMCALLYRDERKTNYCRRMDYTIAKTMELEYMSGSHGNCFNGSHYGNGNIELRLIGGQKDFACFRNTMESVFHLIEAVKSLSWSDCDKLEKIFSGCNQYVFDRIKSYCKERGTITDSEIDAIRTTVKRENLL